jgi:hypothetical protein
MSKLTQDELKDLFFYYPDDGIFVKKANGRITGSLDNDGYYYLTIYKKQYKLARLAFLYMTGNWPENDIDHIDRNRSNDKWNNLRDVTRSQNMRNKGATKKNISGVRGISWHKLSKTWCASIGDKGKIINLGYFKEKIDAITMRKDAEKVYGYNF